MDAFGKYMAQRAAAQAAAAQRIAREQFEKRAAAQRAAQAATRITGSGAASAFGGGMGSVGNFAARAAAQAAPAALSPTPAAPPPPTIGQVIAGNIVERAQAQAQTARQQFQEIAGREYTPANVTAFQTPEAAPAAPEPWRIWEAPDGRHVVMPESYTPPEDWSPFGEPVTDAQAIEHARTSPLAYDNQPEEVRALITLPANESETGAARSPLDFSAVGQAVGRQAEERANRNLREAFETRQSTADLATMGDEAEAERRRDQQQAGQRTQDTPFVRVRSARTGEVYTVERSRLRNLGPDDEVLGPAAVQPESSRDRGASGMPDLGGAAISSVLPTANINLRERAGDAIDAGGDLWDDLTDLGGDGVQRARVVGGVLIDRGGEIIAEGQEIANVVQNDARLLLDVTLDRAEQKLGPVLNVVNIVTDNPELIPGVGGPLGDFLTTYQREGLVPALGGLIGDYTERIDAPRVANTNNAIDAYIRLRRGDYSPANEHVLTDSASLLTGVTTTGAQSVLSSLANLVTITPDEERGIEAGGDITFPEWFETTSTVIYADGTVATVYTSDIEKNPEAFEGASVISNEARASDAYDNGVDTDGDGEVDTVGADAVRKLYESDIDGLGAFVWQVGMDPLIYIPAVTAGGARLRNIGRVRVASAPTRGDALVGRGIEWTGRVIQTGSRAFDELTSFGAGYVFDGISWGARKIGPRIWFGGDADRAMTETESVVSSAQGLPRRMDGSAMPESVAPEPVADVAQPPVAAPRAATAPDPQRQPELDPRSVDGGTGRAAPATSRPTENLDPGPDLRTPDGGTVPTRVADGEGGSITREVNPDGGIRAVSRDSQYPPRTLRTASGTIDASGINTRYDASIRRSAQVNGPDITQAAVDAMRAGGRYVDHTALQRTIGDTLGTSTGTVDHALATSDFAIEWNEAIVRAGGRPVDIVPSNQGSQFHRAAELILRDPWDATARIRTTLYRQSASSPDAIRSSIPARPTPDDLAAAERYADMVEEHFRRNPDAIRSPEFQRAMQQAQAIRKRLSDLNYEGRPTGAMRRGNLLSRGDAPGSGAVVDADLDVDAARADSGFANAAQTRKVLLDGEQELGEIAGYPVVNEMRVGREGTDTMRQVRLDEDTTVEVRPIRQRDVDQSIRRQYPDVDQPEWARADLVDDSIERGTAAHIAPDEETAVRLAAEDARARGLIADAPSEAAPPPISEATDRVLTRAEGSAGSANDYEMAERTIRASGDGIDDALIVARAHIDTPYDALPPIGSRERRAYFAAREQVQDYLFHHAPDTHPFKITPPRGDTAGAYGAGIEVRLSDASSDMFGRRQIALYDVVDTESGSVLHRGVSSGDASQAARSEVANKFIRSSESTAPARQPAPSEAAAPETPDTPTVDADTGEIVTPPARQLDDASTPMQPSDASTGEARPVEVERTDDISDLPNALQLAVRNETLADATSARAFHNAVAVPRNLSDEDMTMVLQALRDIRAANDGWAPIRDAFDLAHPATKKWLDDATELASVNRALRIQRRIANDEAVHASARRGARQKVKQLDAQVKAMRKELGWSDPDVARPTVRQPIETEVAAQRRLENVVLPEARGFRARWDKGYTQQVEYINNLRKMTSLEYTDAPANGITMDRVGMVRFEGAILAPDEIAALTRYTFADGDTFLDRWNRNLTKTRGGGQRSALEMGDEITASLDMTVREYESLMKQMFPKRDPNVLTKAIRGYTRYLREKILGSWLSAPRYAGTQFLGNPMLMALGGYGDAITLRNMTTGINRSYRDMRKARTFLGADVLDTSETLLLSDRIALTWGTSTAPQVRRHVSSETEVFTQRGVVEGALYGDGTSTTRKALSQLARPVFGDVRVIQWGGAIDMAARDAVYTAAFNRTVRQRIPEFRIQLNEALMDAGMTRREAVAITGGFQTRFRKGFTSNDVRDYFGKYLPDGKAERMARDWQSMVNATNKHARSEVSRVLFSGKTTNVDQLLSSVMLFHYFLSRQYLYLIRQSLHHPGLINTYLSFNEMMDEYADKNDVPSWLRGFVRFTVGGPGIALYFHPMNLLSVGNIFGDAPFEFESDKNWIETVLDKTDDWIFLHPAIMDGLNLFGYLGDARNVDPFRLAREVDVLNLALGWGAHRGWWDGEVTRGDPVADTGNWLRDRLSGILPGSEQVDFVETVAREEREFLAIINDLMAEAGITDPYEMEAIRTDPSHPIYQEAESKYLWNETANIAVKFLPFRGQTRLLNSEGRDLILNRTDEQKSMSNITDRRAREMKTQQNAYYAIGDNRIYSLADEVYQDVVYSDEVWFDLEVDGIMYTHDQIEKMSDEERRDLAIAWLAETGLYYTWNKTKAERDEFLSRPENAEFATFKRWQSEVYGYEGGVEAYWQMVIQDNPNARQFYEDLDEKLPPHKREQALAGQYGYMAVAGIPVGWAQGRDGEWYVTSNYKSPPPKETNNYDPVNIANQTPAPTPYTPYVNEYNEDLRKELDNYQKYRSRDEQVLQEIYRDWGMSPDTNLGTVTNKTRKAIEKEFRNRTGDYITSPSPKVEDYFEWRDENPDGTLDEYIRWKDYNYIQNLPESFTEDQARPEGEEMEGDAYRLWDKDEYRGD